MSWLLETTAARFDVLAVAELEMLQMPRKSNIPLRGKGIDYQKDLICLLPILTPLFASGATLYRAVEPVRGRYVVILNDTHRGNVTSIADEFARTRSIRVGFRYESLIYGFSFSGTEEAAQRIANDPRVK